MNGERYTANEIIEGSPTMALKKDGFYNQDFVFEEGLDNFLIAHDINSSIQDPMEDLTLEHVSLDEFSKELTGKGYDELCEDMGVEIDDKKDNNYKKHFRKELEILKSQLKEGDKLAINDFIPLIEDITDVFSQQGHSGGSAPFYRVALVETIKKVLSFKPLSEITCEEGEWNEICDDGTNKKSIYQNKRESAVFKEGKEGKPYYLDAIIWKGEEDGDTFSGTVDGITSRQFIKLPFMPKTFYIDVIKIYNPQPGTADHVDDDGAEYVYKIKDMNQLKDVSEYYNTCF